MPEDERRDLRSGEGRSGPPDADAHRGRRDLLVLGCLLILALGCVWLVRTLRHEAQVEDCLASGRRDCDRLVTTR